MSDDNTIAVAKPETVAVASTATERVPESDLSMFDLTAVDAFIDAGRPGIDKITPDVVERIGNLYLGGKSYVKIARDLRMPKVIIQYLSHKFGWHEQRKILIEDTAKHIEMRIENSKRETQDFLVNLKQAFEKEMTEKINKYMACGEQSAFKGLDIKALSVYLKVVEALGKVDVRAAAANSKTPAVGINLGDGVTIEKINDDRVEITPKQKAVGNILKQFADMRREQESQSVKTKIKKGEEK